MSSSGRTLVNAFREINAMADRINLPNNRCQNKQVSDGKNLKGLTNDAIASACLYIACPQEGVDRKFKEICAVSKRSKKEIRRCFKIILKALETTVDLITNEDFTLRFCYNLGIPNIVKRILCCITCREIPTWMSSMEADVNRSCSTKSWFTSGTGLF